MSNSKNKEDTTKLIEKSVVNLETTINENSVTAAEPNGNQILSKNWEIFLKKLVWSKNFKNTFANSELGKILYKDLENNFRFSVNLVFRSIVICVLLICIFVISVFYQVLISYNPFVEKIVNRLNLNIKLEYSEFVSGGVTIQKTLLIPSEAVLIVLIVIISLIFRLRIISRFKSLIDSFSKLRSPS